MFKKLASVIKKMEIANEKTEPEVVITQEPEISQDGGPIADDEKPVIEDLVEKIVEDKENAGEPDNKEEPTVQAGEENKQTSEESDKHEEEELTTEKTTTVSVSIGPVTEVQEVSSSTTTNNKSEQTNILPTHRTQRRRSSYQGGSGAGGPRGYGGSFQNYGLTYLPYKSNFEPSEDARRRADEFLKTLKL